MKLSRLLTVTMAVLLALGLIVADVATYTSVRSFLFGRADEQLGAAQHQAYDYLVYAQHKRQVATEARLDARVDPDVYVIVLGPYDTNVLSRPSGSPKYPDAAPLLPRQYRVQRTPTPGTFGRRHGTFRPSPNSFDAGAAGDPLSLYRVQAVDVPQGTLITAISLNPTLDTLNSLLRIEVISSLIVLLLLCGAVAWTVRRGMRPLEAITATATAIGSGDLTRRVPASSKETEVARLGTALNAMLAQIEEAFAEKSNSEDRLRRFVADASHELRTPLTSIRGYAELLRKGVYREPSEQVRALGRLEEEAVRMGRLVDDLLLLARLDQGRVLEAGPVDLRRIAADAVADAGAVDPDRELELVAPRAVVVAGDADRLRQVAHNFIRNALVHTPPDADVRVEVRRDGDMGVLEVADKGPGLPEGADQWVFDRFYRGDASRSRGGTGLGLSIARAIAENLDGSTSVRSVHGQGATFTVAIPLMPDQPGDPERGPGRSGSINGWHRNVSSDPEMESTAVAESQPSRSGR